MFSLEMSFPPWRAPAAGIGGEEGPGVERQGATRADAVRGTAASNSVARGLAARRGVAARRGGANGIRHPAILPGADSGQMRRQPPSRIRLVARDTGLQGL